MYSDYRPGWSTLESLDLVDFYNSHEITTVCLLPFCCTEYAPVENGDVASCRLTDGHRNGVCVCVCVETESVPGNGLLFYQVW